MEAMVDQAMRDGAFGLSSALIYVPGTFAKTDELVALAKVAAKHKGIYISHIRGESFNLFNAIDEAIGIGRDAGLPVVIFHLKVGAKANWGRMNEAVAAIEKANAGGVRVSATMYPYTAGGTGLAATLAALGPGGRPREDARAAQGSGDAREGAAGDRDEARWLGEPADGRDLRRHPGRVGAAGVRSIDRRQAHHARSPRSGRPIHGTSTFSC